MTRRTHMGLVLAVVLVVPAAAAAWWWHYGPAYLRGRRLAAAEKALEAGNLAGAEELLLPLVAEEPGQARAQFLYAQVLRRYGRDSEAWVALARALQLGLPPPEAHREYALLEASEDFPRAESALRQEAEEHPDDAAVVGALAQGYARAGRPTEADRWYTRWLALAPEQTDVWLERGRVRLAAGRYGPAADDFREVLRRAPRHFQARLELAHCLLSEAKMAEAEAELLACRNVQPSRPEPWLGLAACALERGDLDEAQKLTKQAVTLDPSSPLALRLHGDVYLRRGRADLAVPVFERLVRAAPRDKQARLKLAQALRQSGDLGRAREQEQRYQQLEQEERSQAGKGKAVPTGEPAALSAIPRKP